jgi:cysteinyl-tRNA synthetase
MLFLLHLLLGKKKIMIKLHQLKLYNTLTRNKEKFEPLKPPFVGMYVCGPTVYSDVHLGNCRTFTSFDVIYRYLTHLGYKVRYVRNITDVGHLVGDADEGEDKIGKKAKLENLEPMEIVQRYTNGFHEVMNLLNNYSPSIEPTATGHILEQIEMTQQIIKNGYGYVANGSVYFDVKKYSEKYEYGKLSGRVIDELLAGQRTLDGQDEKKSPEDFALWKNASPTHLMRWNSPWGTGFPGWHLECSVMSMKYLGETFDIHGGGMDLKFPHHECEIAQSVGAYQKEPVKYWLHTNMLTVNGQRMGKSVGNSILPAELFTGTHPLLEQPYSPMTLRFFMLQTHYRSTMDITNDALKAAQKGYINILNGLKIVKDLTKKKANLSFATQANETLHNEVEKLIAEVYAAMDDDFNTAMALAALSEILKKINILHAQPAEIEKFSENTFDLLLNTYSIFVTQVLGLQEEVLIDSEEMLNLFMELYAEAKRNKDYQQVDLLRERAKNLGIALKDMKTGIDWGYCVAVKK